VVGAGVGFSVTGGGLVIISFPPPPEIPNNILFVD